MNIFLNIVILLSVAFVVPYLVTLVLVALPLLLMETALGQYTSHGPITCWKMAPLSKGIHSKWKYTKGCSEI